MSKSTVRKPGGKKAQTARLRKSRAKAQANDPRPHQSYARAPHTATEAGTITGGATAAPADADMPGVVMPWERHQELLRAEQGVNILDKRVQELHHELDAARRQPQVRVLRLVEYAGDRDAVESQIRQSIHGTVQVQRGKLNITAVTLHEYPEVLKIARMAPSTHVDPTNAQDAERADATPRNAGQAPQLLRQRD